MDNRAGQRLAPAEASLIRRKKRIVKTYTRRGFSNLIARICTPEGVAEGVLFSSRSAIAKWTVATRLAKFPGQRNFNIDNTAITR